MKDFEIILRGGLTVTRAVIEIQASDEATAKRIAHSMVSYWAGVDHTAYVDTVTEIVK